MIKTFSKILVGQYFPDFQCFVRDCDILYVDKPKSMKVQATVIPWRFTSIVNQNLTSKLGWVVQTEVEFTSEKFIDTFLPINISEVNRLMACNMLKIIDEMTKGTVVAVSFAPRGVENRRMDMWIHPIIQKALASSLVNSFTQKIYKIDLERKMTQP